MRWPVHHSATDSQRAERRVAISLHKLIADRWHRDYAAARARHLERAELRRRPEPEISQCSSD